MFIFCLTLKASAYLHLFLYSQIPVLINLSQDADVNLPVKPLIFALAMGACLGGTSLFLSSSYNQVWDCCWAGTFLTVTGDVIVDPPFERCGSLSMAPARRHLMLQVTATLRMAVSLPGEVGLRFLREQLKDFGARLILALPHPGGWPCSTVCLCLGGKKDTKGERVRGLSWCFSLISCPVTGPYRSAVWCRRPAPSPHWHLLRCEQYRMAGRIRTLTVKMLPTVD